MKRINIIINENSYPAELNSPKTAQAVYDALPIEAEANFWGEEIYFVIPLKMDNEKPTERVKVGDLAYWPQGSAFCIFYGRTPGSRDGEPKPYSPCTIIGKFKGEIEELKNLSSARVKLEKI